MAILVRPLSNGPHVLEVQGLVDNPDSNPLHLTEDQGLSGEGVEVPNVMHPAEEARLRSCLQLLDLDLLTDNRLGDVGLPLG